MSALTLNSTIINSTILNFNSMVPYALDCVNKSALTQLARTTVPVAVTTTLLMTYTTAWVCDIHVLCTSYIHVLTALSSV